MNAWRLLGFSVDYPLGNGSLVNGIGAWIKARRPGVRVVAVAAAGAPAMERSWRAGRVIVTPDVATIADGVAVRVPVPEALAVMRATVDEVRLVDEAGIIAAMRLAFGRLGLVVAPAVREEFRGREVATVLCGAIS